MRRTAAQVLVNTYTAANCCDASDARYGLQTLIERSTVTELGLPAVMRRIVALRRVIRKYEPTYIRTTFGHCENI